MDYWDQGISAINKQLIPKDPTELNQLVQPTTTWDAPDVPLECVASMEFRDLNGRKFIKTRRASIYKFPWYLSFLYLYYGIKHWWKTRKWPLRILYFPNDKQLDKVIFLEVIQHPQNYYSLDDGWGSIEEEVDWDEPFEEDA